MPRPRSDEKRNAILTAAVQVLAEQGLEAPTPAISKRAGVAEGTLFIYFKTKSALFNALYKQVKLELADAMMSNYPRRSSVKQRLQHVWDCYVQWAVAHPAERKALLLLDSYKLSPEAKAAGQAPFEEVLTMARDAVAKGLFRKTSLEFIVGNLQALAQNTMNFMIAHPKEADSYRQLGFEMLWAAITRKGQ